MTKIYTLTLALMDSATQTPQIHRRQSAAARRYLNLAAAGSTWPAP